jgi:peptidoglycan/LPS O-acetylase OafA/YrhL
VKRIPALDGVRGYAILGVVAVHLLGASGVLRTIAGTDTAVVVWGALGYTLDTFFIISGFVLFLPVVRKGGEFGGAARFWINRAARLLPAYWLAVTLSAVLVTALPPASTFDPPSLAELAAHLAVLQMPFHFLDFNFAVGFTINGPLWLISLVVTFYLLLPLIAGPFYRHPIIGLGIGAAITVGWKLILAHAPHVLAPFTNVPEQHIQVFAIDQFPGWAFSLTLGMAAAWTYHYVHQRWTREQLERFATIVIGPLLVVLIAVAYLRGLHALTATGYITQKARMFPMESVLDSTVRACFILVLTLGPAWLVWPFTNKVASRLAELSYGVYLFHFIVISYGLTRLPINGTVADLAIWAVVVLPASLVIAAISRRYLETPIIQKVRRWTDRRYGPRDAPVAVAPESG